MRSHGRRAAPAKRGRPPLPSNCSSISWNLDSSARSTPRIHSVTALYSVSVNDSYLQNMGVHSPISVDRLRKRDGDLCWLCGGKLDFAATPVEKRRPTREHLFAISNGGPNSVDNTVLCHFGCNLQLNSRPLVEKLKIRDKRRDHRLRQQLGAPLQPASAQPRQAKVMPNNHQQKAQAAG
jgi:hypothetical protein